MLLVALMLSCAVVAPPRDAFARLGVHRSCGACVGAGGAWCLPGGRCVPDGRGFCGKAVSPQQHVGMAGHGRCPDRAGAILQAYVHAPRRPPLPPPNPAACAAACTTAPAVSVGAASGADAQATAAQHLSTCGLVVLSDAFDAKLLRQLRVRVLEKMRLPPGGGGSKGHKYELPGVRGARRAELVLPASKALAGPLVDAIRRPALLAALSALLGHAAPALDFVSALVSWPGAAAQELHRDAEVASEAALLVFVPLDEARVGAAGPPEMCPCTHFPAAGERAGGAPSCRAAGRWAAEMPLGSALAYDPGLVHRGLPNRAAGDEPRLMLHLTLAPRGARVRARPEVLLGGAARTHAAKWRALTLSAGCEARTPLGCGGCRGGGDGGWRTGCAWCTAARSCVPDLAGLCASAEEHVGGAGLGGMACPNDEL